MNLLKGYKILLEATKIIQKDFVELRRLEKKWVSASKCLAILRQEIEQSVTFLPEQVIEKLNMAYDSYDRELLLIQLASDEELMPDVNNLTKQEKMGGNKAANYNGSDAYYNSRWSIWDKIQYFLYQSDEPLNVADLQVKILDQEAIEEGSAEAKRICFNINATLSKKFSEGNNAPVERIKVRNEFRYSIAVEEKID